jgi:hypothetical protein
MDAPRRARRWTCWRARTYRLDPAIVKEHAKFSRIHAHRDGHDNVAISNTSFDNKSSLGNDRAAFGSYDQHILKETYDHDNDRFKCHIKQNRSGHAHAD